MTIIHRFFLPFVLTVVLVGGTVAFDAARADSIVTMSSDSTLIHAILLTGENVSISSLSSDGVSNVNSSLVDTPLPSPPFNITTGADTQVALTFGGRVTVRIDTNSLVVIHQVVLTDDGTPHVVVELAQGRLSATNALAGGLVDVYVNSVLVMPSFGAITVSYPTPETSFTVDALTHSAHVAFLRPDWRQFMNNSDEAVFLNLFTLGEGYRTTIDPAKITDRISSLRVSKLVKEFPVMPLGTVDDAWTTLNTSQDYAATQTFQNTLLDGQSTISLASWYTNTSGTLHDIVTALTVMPDKIALQKTTFLREAYSAFFAAALENDASALDSARSIFLSAVTAADPTVVTPFLKVLTADFMSILPSSPLYSVKEAVRSVTADHFTVVAGMVRDTESLLATQDVTRAQTLYTALSPVLTTALQTSTSLDDQQTYFVFALKTALDGLLYRYGALQTEANYAPVAALEDALVNAAPDQIEAAERRQTFVATRLQLLKRLLYLGKNKVVGVAAVTSFGAYLLETTEDLYVAGATTVAVNTYFAQELSSASDWLRFFQSPEFLGLTAADDLQTVFQDFLAKETSQALLLSYVQTGVSDTNAAAITSLEDAISDATNLLHSAKIEFTTLTPLNDAENRLFSITGGMIKGVPFSADYDRITDLLYNISIKNQSYNTGVLRKNFANFVSALIAGQTLSYTNTEGVQTVTEHSILERVAIEVLLESFSSVDLSVTDDHVTIVDLEKQKFTVTDVQFRGSDAVFSFDYSASDKQASNLSIRTLLGVKKVDGIYGLDELENVVETTYDAASSALFGN